METKLQELPMYQSHKVVRALKIKLIGLGKEPDAIVGSGLITPEEDGYAAFTVTKEYMDRHNPQVGGYYVLYEGGYESWSPADAFESGYTPTSADEMSEEKPQPNLPIFRILAGRDKHTTVHVMDEPGAGNGNHHYQVRGVKNADLLCDVQFQNGPYTLKASVDGIHNEDLLAIVIDRLEGFQSGEFACDWNEAALSKLKTARANFEARTLEREERGVEGTNEV